MRKLTFTLLLAISSIVAQAQGFQVTVISYLTAQYMPNYPVYLVSDPNSSGQTYFSPILFYTDATGTYNGTFPAMPVGAEFHFETYDSCLGSVVGPVTTYDTTLAIATALSVCGNNSQFPINGTVYMDNMMTASDGMVYFISKCPDGSGSYILNLVDSTPILSNGTYELSGFPAMQTGCVVLVKAALNPTNPEYSTTLPTYHGPGFGVTTWNGGAVFVQAGQPSIGVDIYMVPGTNPGGPAFIGGSVLQGANKTTGVGDPLVSRILILTNGSGQAVAYTYSDATGHFQFPNLAYGTYKLHGDALGKTNPPLTVTLSASNATVNNVLFEENSDEFVGSFTTTGTNELAGKYKIAISPNPAAEVLSVKGADQIRGAKNVKIFAANGSLISSTDIKDTEQVSIQVGHLSAGMYIVELNTAEGNAILKMVK